MDPSDPPSAYGVFKPVGHIVIAFPSTTDMDAATQAVTATGATDITRMSAEQMQASAKADIENAGVLASIGQELNLRKEHLSLAESGHDFLIVKTGDDEQVQQVADVAKQFKAARAQRYGRLLIEELLETGGGVPRQTPESPATGLDQQSKTAGG